MSLNASLRSTTHRLVALAIAAAAAAACSKKDATEPPPPPPSAPTIALSPAAVTVTDTVGTAGPDSVTIAVSNSATGSLTGLSLDTVTFGAGAKGWVTAAISGADAPSTITLKFKTDSLAAGTYTATVPVRSTATGVTNSPLGLQVSLTMAPKAGPAPVTGPSILAVGNIAHCAPTNTQGNATAKLIAAESTATLIVLGDNVYPQAGGSGPTTLADFQACYDPVWGAFKSRTYAVVGNMEQDSMSLSAGADAYFGASRVGPVNRNYYSFDIGTWHVIVLNVIGGVRVVGYGNNTTQLNWLTADLAANANKKCVLAIWHDAMWQSSNDTSQVGIENSRQSGVWRELYNAGADVVINGGRHIYERMAPMYYDQPSPQKFIADSARGLRQFNSGLGGDGSESATVAHMHPLSQYRQAGAGVLKMTLGDGAYSWVFLNTDGTTSDAGQATCH